MTRASHSVIHPRLTRLLANQDATNLQQAARLVAASINVDAGELMAEARQIAARCAELDLVSRVQRVRFFAGEWGMSPDSLDQSLREFEEKLR
jgi:hypothetical protein